MTGEWVRKKPYWWQYRLAGQERAYADVLQQREEGPDGVLWDALLAAGIGMAPLVEGVTLEVARAAVERYAQGQSGIRGKRSQGGRA